MTISRTHLVERAMQAMGGLDAPPVARARPPQPVPPEPVLPEAVEPLPTGAVPPEEVPGSFARVQSSVPAGETSSVAVRTVVGLEVLTKAGLVSGPASGRTRVTEEISVAQHQVLRTVLAADRNEARSRVVLVTSAHPREGKTFTALNIAGSLALGGSHPVLLIDVDGKAGSLSALLGLADHSGLRDLATDPSRAVRPALVATEIARLSVLPHGLVAAGKASPPGTALAAAVRRVAESLPGYIILLDSPPCLSASDAGTLATVSGQVVLVVEAERTQRSEVEASLDLVEACPVLQLLLNKARLTQSDTFGAYAEAYAKA